MSLLGTAVVAIWNGILPEGRANFIEWHNREHIPERIAIPGFLRGRRYLAERGSPQYFTLYEASDAAVLTGEPYLSRLNDPTPWTKRSTADFRDTLRGVCTIVRSRGCGVGGHLLTLRFDVPAERHAAAATALLASLDEVSKESGVSGTHLCIADEAASGLQTAERKGRQVDVPNWIALVEGSLATGLEAASAVLSKTLEAVGATDVEEGLYRLEFSLSTTAGEIARIGQDTIEGMES